MAFTPARLSRSKPREWAARVWCARTSRPGCRQRRSPPQRRARRLRTSTSAQLCVKNDVHAQAAHARDADTLQATALQTRSHEEACETVCAGTLGCSRLGKELHSVVAATKR
eukprot:6206134-Pleurochrysis_carterae.AAC.1